MRRAKYLNAVLTANAVLLAAVAAGLFAASDAGVAGPSAAVAAQPDTSEGGGLTSAADQRKLMIAELRRLNSRLERIESRLNSGLTVKVTEMPELKLPKEGREQGK